MLSLEIDKGKYSQMNYNRIKDSKIDQIKSLLKYAGTGAYILEGKLEVHIQKCILELIKF